MSSTRPDPTTGLVASLRAHRAVVGLPASAVHTAANLPGHALPPAAASRATSEHVESCASSPAEPPPPGPRQTQHHLLPSGRAAAAASCWSSEHPRSTTSSSRRRRRLLLLFFDRWVTSNVGLIYGLRLELGTNFGPVKFGRQLANLKLRAPFAISHWSCSNFLASYSYYRDIGLLFD